MLLLFCAICSSIVPTRFSESEIGKNGLETTAEATSTGEKDSSQGSSWRPSSSCVSPSTSSSGIWTLSGNSLKICTELFKMTSAGDVGIFDRVVYSAVESLTRLLRLPWRLLNMLVIGSINFLTEFRVLRNFCSVLATGTICGRLMLQSVEQWQTRLSPAPGWPSVSL